jgi:hypothetical protein
MPPMYTAIFYTVHHWQLPFYSSRYIHTAEATTLKQIFQTGSIGQKQIQTIMSKCDVENKDLANGFSIILYSNGLTASVV